MKKTNLFLLLSISISGYAQVESVELFPEQINNSALNVNSPSMNSQENRLCFKKTIDNKEAVMISDKSADGKWSEPYAAFLVSEEYVYQGCSLSPDGKRIYFDMDNDLYTIDYVSEKKWSKPQKLKAVSDDVMECRPSISGDGQTLSFIRNIKSSQHPDADWAFAPFTSTKNKDGWAPPNKLRLVMKGDEELQAINYRGANKLCFYSSGSMLYGWGNYYGVPDATGGLTSITKIEFNGGFIVWVNDDYTRGLIITATNPSKIAAIKFSQALTDQMLAVNKKK